MGPRCLRTTTSGGGKTGPGSNISSASTLWRPTRSSSRVHRSSSTSKLPFLFRTPQNSYRTGLGLGASSQYFAESFRPASETKPTMAPPLPADVANELLLLPDIDRRIIQLARQLDPGGTTPDRARAFERYLRTNFSYTTDLLDNEVPDPLANFLFERRQGHCEYFASAMAVMLRAVHIPSRVATGFQSGVYNPITGWHVLRSSDAHSWVEAWAPGHGWMTFDPTPPANSPQGKPWTTLALYLDTMEMWWQRWVVDYNLEHQLYLASRFEQSTRKWNRFSPEEWLSSIGRGVETGMGGRQSGGSFRRVGFADYRTRLVPRSAACRGCATALSQPSHPSGRGGRIGCGDSLLPDVGIASKTRIREARLADTRRIRACATRIANGDSGERIYRTLPGSSIRKPAGCRRADARTLATDRS